jgi:hypothetical protein
LEVESHQEPGEIHLVPREPAASQRRWDGILDRNWLRGQEIFETRFCLLRDLKVRRDMPKDVRRALRRLKETNGDHLTPQERAKKEGRTIPDPEEPDMCSLLGIRPPRNQPGIGKHRSQMEMGRLYGQSSWPPWGGLTGSVRRGALSEKQVDDWQKLPSVADRTFMTHEIMQCLRSPIQPAYPVDTRVGRNLIDRSYD